MSPPETTRIGFRNPILSERPELVERARQWLLGYQAGHSGVISSIVVFEAGIPPHFEIWVELVNDDHTYDIIVGVEDMLENEVRAAGLVMVPKSLIDRFSKPLDFQVIKC